jgi:hypothetical protein
MRFQKRMLEKTNQPYSYLMADVEKAEKELNMANRKLKKLQEDMQKIKVENDTLKTVRTAAN